MDLGNKAVYVATNDLHYGQKVGGEGKKKRKLI